MESSSEFTIISEGKAKIRVPSSSKVFYNPVQEFNRDLSIAVLSVFSEIHHSEKLKTRKRQRSPDVNNTTQEVEPVKLEIGTQAEKIILFLFYQSGLEILEALAATGLRAIRYALEVPGVKQIYANDISKTAVQIMNQNIEENNVNNLVTSTLYDAAHVMRKRQFESETKFDVVDLDPYGCPTNLLDPAVCSLADNGLLLVTCTDMAVLAGNTPESCYAKYGSISLRSPACHEMALRIVLHTITNVCTRYGRYMEPLLSISADFYIRVFVVVRTSPFMCKSMSSKMSTVYKCRGCNMTTLLPLGSAKSDSKNMKFTLLSGPPVDKKCEHCGFPHLVGGPIWTGPLYNTEFLGKLCNYIKTEDAEKKFNTVRRMRGMLGMMQEELQDIPLYYTVPSLTNTVHCEAMPLRYFFSALVGAGYRVSSSHCAQNSVKTDAPQSVVWDVIRTWVQTHPVSEKRLQDSVAARTILSKQPTTEIIFDKKYNTVPKSLQGLVRYQQNPAPYWGPGTKGNSKQKVILNSKEVECETDIKSSK
ncbi:probable tRNA (guanine(26)-N(2))-dimethyltransferase isoform X1 [Myzus persicae]|uniref:probable tRNA (guanine(26)-N(2))-dimethyltransferase isoform X1 n=1 Tax=Myzus persicae TaxID=13164 RepID=UPI000B933F69|nr:probable tRNA (guanine(26)-N(2))-dimethyltransferase isoform X1 [Myzus persicae]XP_022164511.1 probable tRNA (guanine(26)-N(2))-dimethyltransferase isoform X1 [Myzus persicae]XP_022164519.1 probable tRNA (guanine(26)-N(2))-dimethyltransferase isoform X1 [Myzus persicae]XP_022164526.1 probable tRNA (guanine(26)-N(2))-dimethyltransferase isoform X1 [Myzus persicae]